MVRFKPNLSKPNLSKATASGTMRQVFIVTAEKRAEREKKNTSVQEERSLTTDPG